MTSSAERDYSRHYGGRTCRKKMIRVIGALYDKPSFMVEIEGTPSSWKTQEAAIRQGCPLSPYLFILYMTVMFSDVKGKLSPTRFQHRVQGTTFDEILFADDTICISRDTKTMNKLLKAIEEVGLNSGM